LACGDGRSVGHFNLLAEPIIGLIEYVRFDRFDLCSRSIR
jgi:hypothetical protein